LLRIANYAYYLRPSIKYAWCVFLVSLVAARGHTAHAPLGQFDKNGATGGCQALYTVIANTSTANPSCANVTFPAGAMDVNAAISGSAFSQYGWIPQVSNCNVFISVRRESEAGSLLALC